MIEKSRGISKEQKEKAKRVNLVEYCKLNGIDLLDEQSKTPKLAQHDSLVFFQDNIDGQWHRYSTGQGGDSIAFIQFYHDVSFEEAVNILLDEEFQSKKIDAKKREIVPFRYYNNEVDTFEKAQNYLVQERMIDSDIVKKCHEKGLIKQDKFGNVVFKWVNYDTGEVVGANEQGTRKQINGQRSFKRTQKNSTNGYGFNIKTGEPKNLKFFESSVDMLSYMTLNNQEENTWYISMEGLKNVVVKNYCIQSFKELGQQPESVTFCTDNDEKGLEFATKWTDHFDLKQPDGSTRAIDLELPTIGKDWNNELISKKNVYVKKVIKINDLSNKDIITYADCNTMEYER